MDGSNDAALPGGEWLGLELDSHPLDEIETLSDALALVGECGLVSLEDLGIGHNEDNSLSPKPSEDGETSSSSATPPPSSISTAKVKKPTGQRQKEELEYLRSTVAQLEQELTSLKKQSEQTAVAVTTPMASMWEDIATRQSEERQRAEVENTKLRVLVEEQLRVVKSFERLLKKRSVTELLGSSVAHAHRKRLATTQDGTASNFQELLEVLNSMVSELEDVMASDRFVSSVLPFRDMQVRADDFFNTTVEAVDMRIAPFDLHELSEATWQQMAHHKHEDTQIIHTDHIAMGDDQYTRDFLVTLDTPRIKATFRGNIVARRIVDQDKVTLVWTSTMKPMDPSSELEGMRQKAWAVLTRVADQAGQPLTLTKTFIVFEPIDSDDPRYKRAVGALTKFVMSSRSEVENVKLRVLVEEQLRVTKSFERLLKNRSVTETNDVENVVAPGVRKGSAQCNRPGIIHDDSEDNVQELSDTLSSMSAELEEVMASDRFVSSELPSRDIQVQADELLNTTLEAVEMRIAPFELHELSDATWQQMAHRKHPNGPPIHTDATFQGIVARRIVEKDRVVFVWAATLKPTDPSSEVEGLREKSYMVLTRVPDSSGEACALTKAFVVFEPIDSDDQQNKRPVGALTKFVMSSVSLHMEDAKQQIENVMLARKSGS